MADQLGVSRTAVWKSIQNLKKDGYKVESVTNKGYMLTRSSDQLNETLLSSMIAQSDLFTDIIYRNPSIRLRRSLFNIYLKNSSLSLSFQMNRQKAGDASTESGCLEKLRSVYVCSIKPDIDLNEIIKFNLFIPLLSPVPLKNHLICRQASNGPMIFI